LCYFRSHLLLLVPISDHNHIQPTSQRLALPPIPYNHTISAHLSCYAQFLSLPLSSRTGSTNLQSLENLDLALLPSFRIRHTHGQTLPSHGCSRFRGRSRSPGPRWWRNWRKRCRCIYPFPWKLHRPSLVQDGGRRGRKGKGREGCKGKFAI
jgi:hypothetical protein